MSHLFGRTSPVTDQIETRIQRFTHSMDVLSESVNALRLFLVELELSPHERATISKAVAAIAESSGVLKEERSILTTALEKLRQSSAIRPSELEGLPDDLVKQLSINNESDGLDYKILAAVENAGGSLSLDHILIALYHATKKVETRKAVTARLYRMSQRGLIYSVAGRKGVYTTNPQLADANSKDNQEEEQEIVIG